MQWYLSLRLRHIQLALSRSVKQPQIARISLIVVSITSGYSYGSSLNTYRWHSACIICILLSWLDVSTCNRTNAGCPVLWYLRPASHHSYGRLQSFGYMWGRVSLLVSGSLLHDPPNQFSSLLSSQLTLVKSLRFSFSPETRVQQRRYFLDWLRKIWRYIHCRGR